MTQAVHEPAYGQFIDIPASTATVWDDGTPVDAGTAIILASNASHLTLESMRHHVMEVSQRSMAHTGGKDTWEGVQDSSGPSAADIAALPADEGYKGVSWMNFTQMWGPLFVPLDRIAADGSLIARTLKCRFVFSNSGGAACYAHVALTTHNSPSGIANGNVSAYSKGTITGVGTQSYTVTLEADIHDAIRESIPARRGSTNGGSVQWPCIPLYVWLCVDSTVSTLLSASVWESRS